MENALKLDTVVLAENGEAIVILDQTLLPNETQIPDIGQGGGYLGSDLQAAGERSAGHRRNRRLWLLRPGAAV